MSGKWQDQTCQPAGADVWLRPRVQPNLADPARLGRERPSSKRGRSQISYADDKSQCGHKPHRDQCCQSRHYPDPHCDGKLEK